MGRGDGWRNEGLECIESEHCSGTGPLEMTVGKHGEANTRNRKRKRKPNDKEG